MQKLLEAKHHAEAASWKDRGNRAASIYLVDNFRQVIQKVDVCKMRETMGFPNSFKLHDKFSANGFPS